MRRSTKLSLSAVLGLALLGSVGCDTAQVAIDIKPGSDANTIKVKSNKAIPVAILGAADVPLVGIDVASLSFGPSDATPYGELTEASYVDVDFDGIEDLVVMFRIKDTGIAAGDTTACLSGAWVSGVPFTACDSVSTSNGRQG